MSAPETSNSEVAPDAAAVVAELKAEVARRRAAGEYPADLVARLEVQFEPLAAEQPIEALAHLETVRPVVSARTRLAPAAIFVKKLIRRSVAWYVRPLAEDQSRFNFAVARRIYRLEARLEELERRTGVTSSAPDGSDDPADGEHSRP
jgi:hypothetical protein